MLRWILIVLIACFWAPLTIYGQDNLFKHFTVEDGLPSNTIYTVYRDGKGFLWVTTDKGVARYNGIKFEKFTTFNGLADNEVFGCREDNEGRLWFICYNGELCYYKNDTFHNPQNTPFLRRPTKQPHAKFISLQKDGSLVYTFYLGEYICCVEKNSCYSLDISDCIGAHKITFHAEKVAPGRFQFLRDSVRCIVDTGSPCKIVSSISVKKWRYIDQIGCQGQEYLYGEEGVYTTNERLLRPFPKGFEADNRLHQAYCNEQHWFFATAHGLYVDSREGEQKLINILPEKDVSCVTQSINGEYWVSTLRDGLYLFPEAFASTGVWQNAYQGKIAYVNEAKGHLFFCGEKNDVHLFENGRARWLLNLPKPNTRFNYTSYYLDTNLSFYYLSNLNTIKVDNLLSEPLLKHQFPTSVMSVNVFKKAVKAKDKFYLNSGANLLEADLSGVRDGYSVRYRTLIEYGIMRVYDVAKSADDGVWFSTIDKIFKIEHGHSVRQPQFGDITFKQFDFFGQHLVGYTHYNQLLVCKNVDEKVIVDTVLQDCVWEKMYKLDDSHVLISTNGPYYVLGLESDGLRKYPIFAVENKYLPLQAEQICVGEKSCYFFNGGSIIEVPKAELLKRGATPVIAFTTLRAPKHSCRIDSVVTLPYSLSGNIAISFSTLSFGGKDVVYQYSISKRGKEKWINFRGDINLANQAFGVYIVKVRARTMSSSWSTPVAFTLVIEHPFWAAWWFIGLSVCATALLIYLTVRRRIQLTLKKKEKEHENKVRFIRSEYKAMNALMNPHFIFNTLNNVQGLVNNDDKLNAIEYLAIFADLVRQNMHNISSEIIPLQKELELVENYLLLEKLRFEDQLNYSIHLEDNVYAFDIMVPPLLIQPLVENSIKHGILPLKSRGIRGTVRVNVYEKDENLVIEVRDNGIGVAKAKERKSLHKSFGLDNLKRRLEQLSIIQGKEITFDLSEQTDAGGEQWTIAIIAMPIDVPEKIRIGP